jgi:hypothetical protein
MTGEAATLFVPVARLLTARAVARRAQFATPGRPNGTAPVFPFTSG